MNIIPRIAGLLSILLVVAAVAFAFGATLDAGFFMDDHYFLKEIHAAGGLHRTLQDLAGNWLGFTGYAYYRPLVTASFALDHALFGLDPFGYHLTNLLLHLANSVLVLALARRLFPPAGRLGALAAALLFATNPVHPNAVGWVAARSDLLVGFCTLGMLVAYFAAWTRRRGLPLLAGIVLFAAALLAKESGVVAAALALLLPAAVSWRRRLLTLSPVFLLLVAYGAVRLTVLEAGLDLHADAAPASLEGIAAALGLLAAQLNRVVNPAGSWTAWITLWPLLFFLPALIGLFRRNGISTLLFAVFMTVLGLLPVFPILGNMDPSLFAGYSRYWYLAVVGPMLIAALSVGGAGRWGVLPFAAFLYLAFAYGNLSRDLFDRNLKRPAEMVAAVAEELDRAGGGVDHQRVNVFLRGREDRYGGVHVNPLAFSAAAVRPFTRRDLPLYPLRLRELTELIRVHGGHVDFHVVTLDPQTGRPVVITGYSRAPRWRFVTDDGPFRLAPGLWKDVDGGGRSPLAFDVIRLEEAKGTGRLLLQVETDRGVFSGDQLTVGRGEPLAFYFRRDDEFLRARSVSRVRLEPYSTQENPLKGVVEVGRIRFADLETERFLEAPAPGVRVRPGPSHLELRWNERTPRELGVRFITVFGMVPAISDHPLRPRDGVPPEARNKIVVGANLGSGWFMVFATPPPSREPGAAPTLRVPLHPLRADISR